MPKKNLKWNNQKQAETGQMSTKHKKFEKIQSSKVEICRNRWLTYRCEVRDIFGRTSEYRYYIDTYFLRYFPSLLQIEADQNLIFYKKVSGYICLSSLRVELESSKDCHVWNVIMYKKGKVDSLYSRMLQKIMIT